MYNFNLPLRIVQTLLSITTIALNGYGTPIPAPSQSARDIDILTSAQ